MFQYIRAFGYGTKSGLDYPGEGTGLIFRPGQIGLLELATSSFGQGISVTPLQQVMAVSAIANGGYLLRPYVIREIRDDQGGVVEKRAPEIIRQVISRDTSKRVTLIMEEVVKQGSGVNATIEGYRIAGKTGTAQKVGPGGVYMSDAYILSFIGFAPAEDPQVLLYIAVDGAKRGPQWGSQVSAPLFRAIIKDVLSYLEISPSQFPGKQEVKLIEVPELKGLTVDEAGALLDTRGLLLKLVGKDGIIKDQTPKSGAQVPMQTGIIVYLEDLWDDENPEQVRVPDLKGMTVKEVGEILSRLNLKMEPVGSGVVVKQEPAAGKLKRGTAVKVYFSSPLQ
jgi:stage V sporulation protein D (sporulation-specific penicillin-binding protein)